MTELSAAEAFRFVEEARLQRERAERAEDALLGAALALEAIEGLLSPEIMRGDAVIDDAYASPSGRWPTSRAAPEGPADRARIAKSPPTCYDGRRSLVVSR